jgi:P2 family phage contractile tail tube protein|nr:MAG TPA: tail tube protein [Caudoviricetes sp.]
MANTASTIPSQIIDYNVYNTDVAEKNKLIGTGTDMTLPTVTNKTTTIELASGDIDVSAMRTENIEFEVPFNLFSEEATRNLSLTSPVKLIIRGAKQQINTSSHGLGYSGLKITVKGFPAEINLGNLKRSDKMDSSIKLNLSYLKYEDGQKELLEIDKLNGIYKINGVDQRTGISSYL